MVLPLLHLIQHAAVQRVFDVVLFIEHEFLGIS